MFNSLKIYNKNIIKTFSLELELSKLSKILDYKSSGKCIVEFLNTNNFILSNTILTDIDLEIKDHKILDIINYHYENGQLNNENFVDLIINFISPFIYQRWNCSNYFCRAIIRYKLNLLDEETLKKYLSKNLSSEKCYIGVVYKKEILEMLSTRIRNINIFTELNFEYKIFYVLKNIEYFHNKLSEVNFDILPYKAKIYFLYKIAEYFKEKNMNRKYNFYLFRLFFLVSEELDSDFKQYVKSKIKIEGMNWNYLLLNIKNLSNKIDIEIISGDGLIIKKNESIYIPTQHMKSKIYLIDKIKIISSLKIRILYFVTNQNEKISVFKEINKYFYLKIEKSVRITEMIYEYNFQEFNMQLDYDLIKIKEENPIIFVDREINDELISFIYRVTNMEFTFLENKDNFSIEFNDNTMIIKKKLHGIDIHGTIRFCYDINSEYKKYIELSY